MRPRTLHLILTFVLTLGGAWAHARAGASVSATAGGGGTSAGPNSGFLDDLTQLVESAGDLLVKWIKPASEERQSHEVLWDSLESPRHTVLTFVNAMDDVALGREKAWERARPALAMANASDNQVREAAHKLKGIFERFGAIRPVALPGPSQVADKDIRRYEIFPYGLEHEWVWEALQEAPNGAIAVALDANGDWVFTNETIAGIDDLYESMKVLPPRYGDNEQAEFALTAVAPTLSKTPWWGWMLLLASLAAGILLGMIVRRVLHAVAARVDGQEWHLTAGVIRGLSAPFSILAFAVALAVGFTYVEFGPTLDGMRWTVVKALLVLSGVWLVFQVVDLLAVAIRKAAGRDGNPFDEMAMVLVRRVLRTFFAVIFLIFLVQNLMGMNIGALLAGIGIIGLAISLAGQDTAKNFFGAVTVFINRPFMVGDWVIFHDELGEVEDVGIQATRIRLLSGNVFVVPNMLFIEDTVENLAMRDYLRRSMDIAITYDTRPEKVTRAMEVVNEVLHDDEVVELGMFDLEKQPPLVYFNEFEDYHLNIRAYYWYRMGEHGEMQRNSDRGWYTYLEHASVVNRKLFARFKEEGIDFAIPSRSIYLANDPKRELGVEVQHSNGSGQSPASRS